MSAAQETIPLVISVDDDHVDRLPEIVESLRDVGMRVERSLPALGTISGSVPQSQLDRVAAVEGVANVERATEIQLPAPDAPIQ